MKNILACFVLAISFIQLNAQTTSLVTVDVRYRIDPKDSAIPAQQFFVSRFATGFNTADKKTLLDLTASRILQKANAGDSVAVYNPVYDLFPGFSPSVIIADCKIIKPADFSKPAGQIGEQSWVYGKHTYFRLRKGKVASDNLMVLPDKKIVYAIDTAMTMDKKGETFIPLLSYQYLLPEKVSVFFTERWNFDFIRGRMDKNVSYYGYFMKKYTSAGDFVGHTPVLCIQNPMPTGVLAKPVLLKKNVVCDVAINWPEQMLKNDSNMQRYAGADAANYMTIAEGNIPAGERSKMLAAIFNFALNNPGNVCRVNGSSVDSLHPFNSSEQIELIFLRRDSFQFENGDNPGTWTTGMLETKRSLDEIYAIRFYEDWYYDAKEFTIKKVVRGIGLILLNYNNMGLPLLEDAGIYIRMN